MVQTFFCYDSNLHKYLHRINHQKYLCAALHETTGKKFWLYERSTTINKLIEDYNKFMQPIEE